MVSLSEIAEKLKKEQSVGIFFHVRPDGDAVGSGIALYLALKSLQIKVDLYCDDVIPKRFAFINETLDIKKNYAETHSALVCLDSADVTRLGSFAKVFAEHKNTFNIDHHVSNPRFAKYNAVIDSSSNCQNVYDLICCLGVSISQKIATALLMGILTDTGNFQHKDVEPKTIETASKLVSLGADLNDISYRMFNAQSKNRAKLFGETMSKIRYLLDDRLAIITVTKKDFERTGALREETEGFIDFVMGIEGVEVGIALSEMENGSFKASLRSKGTDVNAVASTFGGGGHVLASGCQLSGEYEEIVDKLRYAVYQHLKD